MQRGRIGASLRDIFSILIEEFRAEFLYVEIIDHDKKIFKGKDSSKKKRMTTSDKLKVKDMIGEYQLNDELKVTVWLRIKSDIYSVLRDNAYFELLGRVIAKNLSLSINDE